MKSWDLLHWILNKALNTIDAGIQCTQIDWNTSLLVSRQLSSTPSLLNNLWEYELLSDWPPYIQISACRPFCAKLITWTDITLLSIDLSWWKTECNPALNK